MKVLNAIKKIVIGILAIIFFSFAILMTVLLLNYNKYGVTKFGSTSLILINDEISSDNYEKGDLVLVETAKIEDIIIGDEVFSYKVDSDGIASIDVGTIGEVHNAEDAIVFENGSTYAMQFVVGKASKTYSDIGTYLSIVESKWGFLFIILVPSFLIFINQLYTLIVEIKYGSEETSE